MAEAKTTTCRGYPPYLQNDASVRIEDQSELNNLPPPPIYYCPGESDPAHFTECCSHGTQMCCPASRWFYEIDNTIATIIAVSVTLSCVAVTITIIVCCFWSRCPLYTACRVRYTHDIATYAGKPDEDFGMHTLKKEKNSNKAPLASSNGSPPDVDPAVV
ncbi:uncharacterized protein LOC111629251 [Centruroides sculpturatus]|uniref:uncharacterized protein LOC111629251 n=1 Tax=Centruroides sculpturatus TaxID=218467 RepID=UPI000C6EEE12|nr:uncharacterized protein LOC111629251 [Centruroides sculpturatus]